MTELSSHYNLQDNFLLRTFFTLQVDLCVYAQVGVHVFPVPVTKP